MTAFTRHRAQWAAVVAIALSTAVHAEPRVDSIGVDLEPLIRAVAAQPARFAVDVSHPVSAAEDGEWEESGNRSRWRYRAIIPSGLSISFHASRIALPPSASLSVHAIRAKADRRGELWGPIVKGDSLDIEIAVDARERAAVVFEIDTFQAGYRSLDSSVPDHSAYKRVRAQSATVQAVDAPACVQNYACSITPDNTGPGSATVAISVRNALYCTATLVNDVPGDNQPYLLTARHCQTGDVTKTDSTAASGVTVYWNAVTPCGETWEKDRKATFTSDGRQFEVAASQDFTSVEFRHTGAAPVRGGPPEPPVVRVCVNERGVLQGEPEIAKTSGSAQIDAAALKIAKGGRYTPEKGQKGTQCISFRMQFELRQ